MTRFRTAWAWALMLWAADWECLASAQSKTSEIEVEPGFCATYSFNKSAIDFAQCSADQTCQVNFDQEGSDGSISTTFGPTRRRQPLVVPSPDEFRKKVMKLKNRSKENETEASPSAVQSLENAEKAEVKPNESFNGAWRKEDGLLGDSRVEGNKKEQGVWKFKNDDKNVVVFVDKSLQHANEEGTVLPDSEKPSVVITSSSTLETSEPASIYSPEKNGELSAEDDAVLPIADPKNHDENGLNDIDEQRQIENKESNELRSALKHALDEQEDGKKLSDSDDEDDGVRGKRFNYASLDAGAIIMSHNKAMKHSSSLLNDDPDQYMLCPCEEEPIWFVVGLSEEIEPDVLELNSFERYSSTVRKFQILGSHSHGTSAYDWQVLGEFEAKPELGSQRFEIQHKAWVRYIKVRFLSYYHDEFYCTMTEVRVYGTTDKFEAMSAEYARRNDEMEQIKESIDKVFERDSDEAFSSDSADDDDDEGSNLENLASENTSEETEKTSLIDESDEVRCSDLEDHSCNETPDSQLGKTETHVNQPISKLDGSIPNHELDSDHGEKEPISSIDIEETKFDALDSSTGNEGKTTVKEIQEKSSSEILNAQSEALSEKALRDSVQSGIELNSSAFSASSTLVTAFDIIPLSDSCSSSHTTTMIKTSDGNMIGIMCVRTQSTENYPLGEPVTGSVLVMKNNNGLDCPIDYSSTTLKPVSSVLVCKRTDEFQNMSQPVYPTITILSSLPAKQHQGFCVELTRSTFLCGIEHSTGKTTVEGGSAGQDRSRVPQRQPGTKNSLESVFNSLTDKTMNLELDMSLMQKYIEDANSKLTAAFRNLQNDQSLIESHFLRLHEQFSEEDSVAAKALASLRADLAKLKDDQIRLENLLKDLITLVIVAFVLSVLLALSNWLLR